MKPPEEVQEAARIVVAFIEQQILDFWPGKQWYNFRSGVDPWIEVTIEVGFEKQYAATDRGMEEIDIPHIETVVVDDYDDWPPADVMLLEAAVRRLL
jgi:hypothetical protein